MSSIIEQNTIVTTDTLPGGQTVTIISPNQGKISSEDAGDRNKTPEFSVARKDAATPLKVEAPKGPDSVVKAFTGSANDTIGGGLNSDYLDGGAGNDSIEGGKGADTIIGGAGNDIIYGDAQKTPNGLAIMKDIGDLIYGGDGNDTIYGQGGNDTLYGQNGDDVIDGGDGNDLIFGGNGNDSIIGGAGDDTIYGGAGADTLTGGDGKDVFRFTAADGTAVDTITDFKTGEDSIKFSGYTQGSTVTYDQNTGALSVNGQQIANLGAGTLFDTVPGADGKVDFEFL